MPSVEPSPEFLAAELAVLLLGAAIIGMLARRLGVPYAVALVIGALLVEESHVASVPQLEPDVILFGFLPPLFDAAFRLDVRSAPAGATNPRARLTGDGRNRCARRGPGSHCASPAVAGHIAIWQPGGGYRPGGRRRRFQEPARSETACRSCRGRKPVNDGVAVTIYTAVLALVLGHPGGALEVSASLGRELLGGVLIGVLLGFVFSRLTSLVATI